MFTCNIVDMKHQEGIETYGVVKKRDRGTGPGSAGQAGDTQGLSDVAETDSESVQELLEEGQALEAELISGLENTPEGEAVRVRTKQVPEDDVPLEYRNQD
jgi:hypothetical protein